MDPSRDSLLKSKQGIAEMRNTYAKIPIAKIRIDKHNKHIFNEFMQDFSRALTVLTNCMKPCIMLPVWTESLGHTSVKKLNYQVRAQVCVWILFAWPPF